MGVAHVGLVHCDPCKCKVKGFRAVSSIERNVSNRRHLQGVRHYIREMRCSGVVKLVMGLHHQGYEKVKFMMELHHGSSKECEASVGASSHGFPHPCEPVSGRLHKLD